MATIFWVSLGLVLYVYAGYPLVLAVVYYPTKRRTARRQ